MDDYYSSDIEGVDEAVQQKLGHICKDRIRYIFKHDLYCAVLMYDYRRLHKPILEQMPLCPVLSVVTVRSACTKSFMML